MCAIRRDGEVRRSRRCFPASSISICGRKAPSFACVMEVRGRLCSCFMAIPTIMCFGTLFAAKLAQRYHVVCPDLRGYGDSSLPDPGARLINYSHRVMAEDMIEVMEQLGHQRFFLIGHDRGARVSHRMCLDHPERVMKLCFMDMLPTYYVWTNTTREWALGTWHWAFLAQPEPFPQTMINAVTPEWFLTNRGGIPRPRPKIVMDEFIRG